MLQTKDASSPDNTGKSCVCLCVCVHACVSFSKFASSSATETSFREEQESSPAGHLSSNWWMIEVVGRTHPSIYVCIPTVSHADCSWARTENCHQMAVGEFNLDNLDMFQTAKKRNWKQNTFPRHMIKSTNSLRKYCWLMFIWYLCSFFFRCCCLIYFISRSNVFNTFLCTKTSLILKLQTTPSLTLYEEFFSFFFFLKKQQNTTATTHHQVFSQNIPCSLIFLAKRFSSEFENLGAVVAHALRCITICVCSPSPLVCLRAATSGRK